MLNRLGNLWPLKNYSDEEVESAVATIKTLGRRLSGRSDESSLSGLQEILNYMRRYSDSLAVQRVACHALSNLAMHVVMARWIVERNGFQLIHKAINKFIEDVKLCWLASSAVWNLARPPQNRPSIGRKGAEDMLNILQEHSYKAKVTNTAIGALSNLSLEDNLKALIAQDSNLQLVLSVLQDNLKNEQMAVLTSGSGLLANIAVSDDHAAKLIRKKGLKIILHLLSYNESRLEDETLFRNSCAALNNLVSAEGFLSEFLKTRGLEIVLAFINKYKDNQMYTGLLDNCLASINADSSIATTSYHYACYHGLLPEFQYLYNKTISDEKQPYGLDREDGNNMTCLDYAIVNNHQNVVTYLSKLGATYRPKENMSEEMISAIKQGQSVLKTVKKENEKALVETLLSFPTDLCKHLVTFQHNVDMLQGMAQF